MKYCIPPDGQFSGHAIGESVMLREIASDAAGRKSSGEIVLGGLPIL